MKTAFRRVLLCVLLLVVLLASAIVPVYILLGIQNRWYLFVPYLALFAILVVLLARTDRKVPASVGDGEAGFFVSHCALVVVGTLHAFLLAAKWFGLAGGDWKVEVAAVIFAAIAFAKWLSLRHPALARRPLWFEAAIDAFAVVTLYVSFLANLFG